MNVIEKILLHVHITLTCL